MGSSHPLSRTFEEESLGWLQEYLRINTVNPPGDVRPAVAWLQRRLTEEGIPTTVYASDSQGGKVNLVARWPSRYPEEPTVLLLNHLDVVPVEREQWTVDPFAGLIHHGYLYGRGALDMKGMAMAEMSALILLKRLNIPLTRDVLILFAADEEVGSALGAQWMVTHHRDVLRPWVVLNEGGEGSIGLWTDDRRPVYAVQVGEKQVCWMQWTAEGPSGHASLPLPDNASERLMYALVAGLQWVRQRVPAPDPVWACLHQRLGTPKSTPFTDALQRDTVSLTALQSGVGTPPKINVIPGRATAMVDGRLLPTTDRETFLQGLRSCVQSFGVTIEVLQTSPVTPTSPLDHPAWQAIEESILAQVPEARVVPMISAGATDSRFFRAHGIPCYGIMPMVLSEELLATVHSHDERLPVEEFHRSVRILLDILKRLAGHP